LLVSLFLKEIKTFDTSTLSVTFKAICTLSPTTTRFELNLSVDISITGASESTFDSSFLTGITSVFVSLQFLHLYVLIPVSLLVDSLVTVPLSHSCSFLEIDVISLFESQRVQ